MTSNSKVNLKQSNDSQTKIADKTDEKVTDKRSDAKVQTVMSENEMQMQVQYIAASQHFGLLLSLLFRPLIIGVLLSFIGGYLLNSRWFLLGLLLIVASPIAWVACTSLQDRFALYDCGVPRPYQELLQRLPSFIVSPMDAANDLDVEGDQPESESLVKLELEKPILPESITHHHSPQIDREQQDWNPLFSIWNQNDWLSPEDFAALHQLLPWCYAETEVESTEWLNLIIASIWKRMNVYANEQLDQKFGVERSLTCVFGEGNRFAKFKITCATLGQFRLILIK